MKKDPFLFMVDPEVFLKRTVVCEARHLNLRLTGTPLEAYRFLKAHTPKITDSLRIRDCIRIAAFLFAMRQNGHPVMVEHKGVQRDLLELMGAFVPETQMDTRKRNKKRA